MCLSFSVSSHADEIVTRTQLLMGNVPVSLSIKTSKKNEGKAMEAMEAAFNEARRLENEVSEWAPESQTSLLNRKAGKALIPIGKDLIEILQLARQVSEITEGAFDITFASPCRGRSSTCPSYKDVIVLAELSLGYLRPGVKIALSGIAKGYIVDRMSDMIRKAGFKRFLVNAGDLFASGRWEIGIRNPNHPDQVICRLKIKNQAVSTSGLYERGAHSVDPRTRKTPRHLKSVTVIARTSALADALATGAFVLGKGKGMDLVSQVRDIEIIFDTSLPPRCVPRPF